MLGFHPYFDTGHNWDGRVDSSTRRPQFNRKEIPWQLFLLDAEWTPGLRNVDRRNGSLQNFQGPFRESSPEPPVLCRSASTNCCTAGPIDELMVQFINDTCLLKKMLDCDQSQLQRSKIQLCCTIVPLFSFPVFRSKGSSTLVSSNLSQRRGKCPVMVMKF